MKRVLLGFSTALFPLGCYTAVVVIGAPAAFDLEASGEGFPLMPVLGIGLLGLALLVAFSRSGRVASSLACALTLVLFALPLAALWHSGRSSGSHIAGLLPFSDARGYYHCARLLTEGELLRASPAADFCSRRPMFVSAFAGVLTLTQGNLRQTLAVLVLLTALSCHLAAREVRASLGTAGATLFLMLLLLFYRRYAGTALTEHLGLALGALGFASLWRSARTNRFGTGVLGLFLLALALNARAGAFLTLPALIAWITWRFRRQDRSPWRELGLATLAVLLGFGLNAALVAAIGTPSGLFSNFSYTLYGVVFGGDWTLALKEHPSLNALPAAEQSRRILFLALDGIARDPGLLVAGMLRAWREFLGTPFPFVFVQRGVVNLSLRVLSVVGLLVYVLRRRESVESMLLAAVVGVVASVPFIPPWDADLMRVYAATMPVLAATPALGLVSIVDRSPLRRLVRPVAEDAGAPQPLHHLLAAGLVALTFLSPLLLHAVARLPRFAASPGPACPDALYVRPPRGAMVTVLPGPTDREYPGVLALRDFRAGFRQIAGVYPGLVTELADLTPPFVIFNALGVQPPRDALVVAQLPLVPASAFQASFWRICGDPAQDHSARIYLHRARSITPAATGPGP